MKFVVLAVTLLAFISAAAQELTEQQRKEMTDCALHGSGGWVEKALYADGKARITYAIQPSQVEGARDVFVVFWNPERTKGELLVFHLSKNSQQKNEFVLFNQGHIWDNQGQPDVSDALGGMYEYRQIKGLLPKLKQRSARLLAVDQLGTSSAVCKTPLDFKADANR